MLNFFKDAGISLSMDADRLKVEGLKALSPGQAEKIREQIKVHRIEIMQELVQADYEKLWVEAWALADFVDGDTAPYADRKAKLPELDQMRAEMVKLEMAGAQVPAGY